MIRPWLEAPFALFARALANGRLAHAWLIAGPDGLGKRELSQRLATSVLCQRRHPTGDACGACRGCELMRAGTHPDFYRVGLEPNDRGGNRTEIVIDQVRELCERLVQTSHAGGLRLALIDPADAVNVSGVNALLKSLEEPPPSVVILLVADQPSRLLPTLRSRCQRLDVRMPSREQALEWLRVQGVDEQLAEKSLALASGNPGDALNLSRAGASAQGALDDLLSLRHGRVDASTVARRWSADDGAEMRLDSVLQWLRLALFARIGGAVGEDPRLQDLTAGLDVAQLSRRFDQLGRLRSRLQAPLRHELLLLDWLRQWKPRATEERTRSRGLA